MPGDSNQNNNNGINAFLQGFQVMDESSARYEQLLRYQQELDLQKQKFSQEQAIVSLGQEAAKNPKVLPMFAAVNPSGAEALSKQIKNSLQEGMGNLQAIQESKITDRPAVYKVMLNRLKQNSYFDSSHFPDEY